MNPYRTLASHPRFALLWLGFSVSVTGDSLTVVALNWYVLDLTGSATALGWLSFCLMAPIALGGLAAGWLLDRFPPLVVLMLDACAKTLTIASIPAAAELGVLGLWQIYLVAAVHGFLLMIPLAGMPSLLPRLVAPEALIGANALETLSYTLGGILGPLAAGLLIVALGAVEVLYLDALSFALFALVLTRLARSGAGERARHREDFPDTGEDTGIPGAIRLVLGNPVLRTTTFMYLVWNIGLGVLLVAVPLFSRRLLGGGPELYGYLLAAIALGEVTSSLLVGSIRLPVGIGIAICGCILLAGASLAGFAAADSTAPALAALFLFGVCAAPLTIWGQTLRMRIIPPAYYGRCFALMRTLMQSGTPIGGLLGGFGVPLVGLRAALLAAALLMLATGAAGLGSRALRRTG